MLLVQVDAVGARRRRLPSTASATSARWRRRGSGRRRSGDELGGDDRLVAPAGERAAKVLLRARAAVDVRGVEEVHAGVEGGANDGGAALLVDTHPEVVAPQPDQRDLERPELRISIRGSYAVDRC